MATLDWHQSRTDGVTLVELQLSSDTRELVRIDSRLDPVWPPREQGVPVAGWDEGSFEGIVSEDDTLVVGYASPAEPADPPVELVEERTLPADESRETQESVTARTLVRTLGEASPPRDVVPDGSGVVPETQSSHRRETTTPAETGDNPGLAWLDTVAQRLSTAEELASASTVREAQATVESVGSIADVRQLAAQVERDEERLRTVLQRSERLADRAASVSVPVTTLERVR